LWTGYPPLLQIVVTPLSSWFYISTSAILRSFANLSRSTRSVCCWIPALVNGLPSNSVDVLSFGHSVLGVSLEPTCQKGQRVWRMCTGSGERIAKQRAVSWSDLWVRSECSVGWSDFEDFSFFGHSCWTLGSVISCTSDSTCCRTLELVTSGTS
jgi:hypothetical protein